MRELIVYAAVWVLKWCRVDAKITVTLKRRQSATIRYWDFAPLPPRNIHDGGGAL